MKHSVSGVLSRELVCDQSHRTYPLSSYLMNSSMSSIPVCFIMSTMNERYKLQHRLTGRLVIWYTMPILRKTPLIDHLMQFFCTVDLIVSFLLCINMPYHLSSATSSREMIH